MLGDIQQKQENFRDIHESFPSIRPGLVFRTSCPTCLSHEDVAYLRGQLGVVVNIDLRSPEEREEGAGAAFENTTVYEHTRGISQVAELMAGFMNEESKSYYMKVCPPCCVGSDSSTPHGYVHQLAPINRARYMLTIVRTMYRKSRRSVAKMMYYGVADKAKAYSMALEVVNEQGLLGLYQMLLRTAQPELRQALLIILDALESGVSLMIFCKAGKDRTGLVSMLLLTCAEAPDDVIVADYARSDGFGKLALGGIEKEEGLETLNKEAFAGAPPQVMVDTLEWLRAEYGSPSQYLTYIGFGEELQRELKDLLLSTNGTTQQDIADSRYPRAVNRLKLPTEISGT